MMDPDDILDAADTERKRRREDAAIRPPQVVIDLDLYERRLLARADGAAPVAPAVEQAYRAAVELLREMRAEALPSADAPSLPPMHHGSTTQAMRAAALPRSGSLRREMVEALRVAPLGFTDDEMEAEFGRAHQTISAARHGLAQQGWVRARRDPVSTEPVTRPTRAGNPATVWELTPHARIALMAERPGHADRG